jgi:putative phosphoesterase
VIVGVISDTHGLLRPEAVEALRGCDRILHAGDVGAPQILETLAKLAPVSAIRGNIDVAPPVSSLPEILVLELEGSKLSLIHNIAELAFDPATEGLAAVVYGHSHRPSSAVKDGVLYFNPGSAGPRRFSLPVTVGKLYIKRGVMNGEIVKILG